MLLLFNGTAWNLHGSLLLTSHWPEPKLHGHSYVPGSQEMWFLPDSHVQPSFLMLEGSTDWASSKLFFPNLKHTVHLPKGGDPQSTSEAEISGQCPVQEPLD